MPIELFLDDVVRLRKQHPCGSAEWRIVRLGADIGIRCLGCQHRVLLPRRDFERSIKSFVSRGADAPTPQPVVAAEVRPRRPRSTDQ